MVAPASGWNPFAPKVTFTRRVPAPHNLGPLTRIALIELSGENALIFSHNFKQAVAADGVFELTDATSERGSLSKLTRDDKPAKEFRKAHPADVYIGVNISRCSTHPASRIHREKQKDKSYVTKTYYWVTSSCNAIVRLIDGRDGRELTSFPVTSTRKSGESLQIYGYAAATVEAEALRSLVNDVRSGFTPRSEEESIVLDKKSPKFKDAMQQIKNRKIENARQLWEDTLAAGEESAALHYNLAAVCEALGDATAAREHYTEASKLDSASKLYREELGRFETREKQKAALLLRP